MARRSKNWKIRERERERIGVKEERELKGQRKKMRERVKV